MIYVENWELPKIFKCWDKGNLDNKELYKTFNCGIGMAVIIDGEIENELLIGKINWIWEYNFPYLVV